MSTLRNLLRQVEQKDAQLASDLAREVKALESRRAFGLNFERHVPESVELPGRQIRRGDKVRFLPERGQPANSVDKKLWRVVKINTTQTGRVAELVRQDNQDAELEAATRSCDDLVVVAEFRDPIYPGLFSTGKVERGGDKPFHTVINAENYHALQALLYTHEGKLDAIYIDPPYNTGAKDWKYNNDYVDADDSYRHSKWLAMMERRLKLAKRLLNPENAVLIQTIDENELARLLLLTEQTFPEYTTTVCSVAMNPKGTPENGFARIDEYYLYTAIGNAVPVKWWDSLNGEAPKSRAVRWRGLTRTGANGVRSKSPGAYFPVFVDPVKNRILGSGEVPPDGDDGSSVKPPPGTVAVWPTPRPNGAHGRWSVVKETFDELLKMGAIKLGRVDLEKGSFPISYLTDSQREQLLSGEIVATGHDADGSLRVEYAREDSKRTAPKTAWFRTAHSASEHGTGLLGKLIPSVPFDYAKSLYAVEDSLRFFVANKPDAVILDFFSGSGTTCHAVMRLNKQDGGSRQCISVTNNEVSADEQKLLREKGLRPSDPEWEALGICEYITKPRIKAAITGRTPEGEMIKGEYKFTDAFPMADGFKENVEFFTMSYEAPRPVAHHRSFKSIAPLLWMRAGSKGRRIDKAVGGFDLADTYGVLFDLDEAKGFLAAIHEAEAVRMAFIVTDDDRGFAALCRDLPERVEAVRLYSSYLTNFTINTGRD